MRSMLQAFPQGRACRPVLPLQSMGFYPKPGSRGRAQVVLPAGEGTPAHASHLTPALNQASNPPPQALRSHSHKVEPLASPQTLASPRLPASLPERPSLGTVSAPRTPAETGRSLCPSEAPGYNSCSVSTCCISRHVDRKQGSLWVCPSSDWRIVYVCMNLDQRTGPI